MLTWTPAVIMFELVMLSCSWLATSGCFTHRFNSSI